MQADPARQCGLIRTPLGLVPEPETCKGCYSVLYTGWQAAGNASAGELGSAARSRLD